MINSVYGPDGNRMAEFEYDPVAGTSTLLREYLWFEGKPIAVIEGGVVYYVRSDHIGRPVFATDATGAKVWEVTYLPFGGVHTSSGTPIALRFPGQWFQSESGLHQNWMRDYDPTTGRYIQADPLGLVDGASVYGYVRQNPGRYVDPRGEQSISIGGGFAPPGGFGPSGSVDISGAWGELLEFSHNYNPFDLAIQAIVEMCTSDGLTDEQRCVAILRGCRKGCTDAYADGLFRGPQEMRKCIRRCMLAHGCPY